jgi:predicted ATPase
MSQSPSLTPLATAYAQLGKFDDALRSIQEAIALVEKTGEAFWEAEVNRVAGETTLMFPKPNLEKAQHHFERALIIARQQQAKSLELRASMSLARLWRDQGKVSEARELLGPIYGWFTEGFDTRDLKDAKALLEELACRGPSNFRTQIGANSKFENGARFRGARRQKFRTAEGGRLRS